jgi:hypothetical protein
MNTFKAADRNRKDALDSLMQTGYVVIENVLGNEDLRHFSSAYDDIMAREKEAPFDPGDGPESPDDGEMADYLGQAYKIDQTEIDRLMKRIRHPICRWRSRSPG